MGSRPPRACFVFDAHARQVGGVEHDLAEPTKRLVTCGWDDVVLTSTSCGAIGSAGLDGVQVPCSPWCAACGHSISRSRWRDPGLDPHTDALTSCVDVKCRVRALGLTWPELPRHSSALYPQSARRTPNR